MTKISNQYSLTNILTADLANSRLGINNVSPTVALDVTGAGKFSGALTLGGNTLLSYSSNTTTANAFPRLGISNTNATQQDFNISELYVSAGNGAVSGGLVASYSSSFPTSTPSIMLRNSGNGPLYFSTNGTIRQTIASTGAATFSSSVTMGGDLVLTPTDSAISFSSGAARFFTGGSERLRITSAGDVGIGTSSPSYKLQVSGTGYFSGALSSGGGISAAGTLSSAALSTSQVLYAANLTTFNYAGSLALTVPNALNSGSVLADIRMYMIWATGFGDASHAGARIWLMIMNGGGTAYSATELLGRDTDGGTGLSISRSAVNQITISSNGYGFIKSVSCMQLITN